MELHSYAKRRASKKWTIDQKRKLVEARINYDSWFNSKPSNSVVPWKKVLSVAKLDDFNVFFVRKQWSNMLTRYKQYKQTRLDGIATNKAIHAEMIQRINQEWEFFEAIHAFMTRKTTNLHSYAAVTQKFSTTHSGDGNEALPLPHDASNVLVESGGDVASESLSRTHEQRDIKTSAMSKDMKLQQHDCVKENIPNNTTILVQAGDSTAPIVEGGMIIYSSDTNEEFEIIDGVGEIEIKDIIKSSSRNTDHDFYSKRSAVAAGVAARKFPIEERQLHYFMDTSEESMGTYNVQHTSSMESSSLPSVMENIELHTENGRTFEIKTENITQPYTTMSSIIKRESISMTEIPSTSTERNTTAQPQNPTSTSGLPNKLSERDKYYRHKRRFNRRLEKRFDAVLNVMGQVVKIEYPSVDVKPLMDTITSLGSGFGGLLSTESEDDSENDDGDGCGRGRRKHESDTTEPRPNNEI